jgi:L-glyceraldehyde 3-phosphate reductase
MKLDYVDIFYSHRPDPHTPLEETMGALAHAVRQGKALYVGISSYNPEQTEKAADILSSLNTPCLIHQPNYSMLERWVEDKLLDTLEAKGIGSIAFCPLAQGLLTEKYLNGIPKDSRISSKSSFLSEDSVTEPLLEKIRQLVEIARNRNQSLAQMALAWLLKDKRITSVLIGASKPSQIEENVNSLNNLQFTDDQIQSIETVLNN